MCRWWRKKSVIQCFLDKTLLISVGLQFSFWLCYIFHSNSGPKEKKSVILFIFLILVWVYCQTDMLFAIMMMLIALLIFKMDSYFSFFFCFVSFVQHLNVFSLLFSISSKKITHNTLFGFCFKAEKKNTETKSNTQGTNPGYRVYSPKKNDVRKGNHGSIGVMTTNVRTWEWEYILMEKKNWLFLRAFYFREKRVTKYFWRIWIRIKIWRKKNLLLLWCVTRFSVLVHYFMFHWQELTWRVNDVFFFAKHVKRSKQGFNNKDHVYCIKSNAFNFGPLCWLPFFFFSFGFHFYSEKNAIVNKVLLKAITNFFKLHCIICSQ